MFRRTFKLAWFKRNRYSLTVIAIGLSVAFIVSTLLLTTSIADVGAPLNDAYDGVEVVVQGPQVTGGDGPVAGISAPVPAEVLDTLVDAGYEAAGFTSPYAQILDSGGNAAGQNQASSNVAEAWLGDSVLNGFEISSGVAPSGPGEAALDSATADASGLRIGATLQYVTDSGLQEAELVGLA